MLSSSAIGIVTPITVSKPSSHTSMISLINARNKKNNEELKKLIKKTEEYSKKFEWDSKSAVKKAISGINVSTCLPTPIVHVCKTVYSASDHNPDTDAYRNCKNCDRHYNYHNAKKMPGYYSKIKIIRCLLFYYNIDFVKLKILLVFSFHNIKILNPRC